MISKRELRHTVQRILRLFEIGREQALSKPIGCDKKWKGNQIQSETNLDKIIFWMLF